jgi:hypothetical protein
MEGQMDVALPLAGLITKPGDHRVPMLVRVAATQPHGTFTRYDLRYTGRVPGKHDLREYLFTAEGAPATNLPALTVSIAGLLPNPHDGWLEESAAPVPSLFGLSRGAGRLMPDRGVLRHPRVGRHEKPARVVETAPRPPSFAERIRPLIQRAAAAFVRRPKSRARTDAHRALAAAAESRPAGANELIVRLRLHPEAGELLGALENWLHRPPGRGEVELEKFLAPYRNLPDETAVPANT